jgi:Oxidoreductase molybdopterin binding domain
MALYLGQASDFAHPVASIGAVQKGSRQTSVTEILGRSFNTTGYLGLSDGDQRAFPSWLTLPGYQDLATGRRWHFFFAWLLVIDASIYLIYGIASGHLWRDLVPAARQLRHIGSSILDHARLRFLRARRRGTTTFCSGLVERPLRLSLGGAPPSRTQITRHDCVERWSCIGKWTGVPLGVVLQRAGLKPAARYIVFYCAGYPRCVARPGGQILREHRSDRCVSPQTILAYDMNGAPLGIPYGAPLRLRVERQLGYKMAKYIMRIEAVASFRHIGGGRGSYWADRNYEWYAGI